MAVYQWCSVSATLTGDFSNFKENGRICCQRKRKVGLGWLRHFVVKNCPSRSSSEKDDEPFFKKTQREKVSISRIGGYTWISIP